MRRFWNGLIWGSAEGPEIKINWERSEIYLRRFPAWLGRWLLRRIDTGS